MTSHPRLLPIVGTAAWLIVTVALVVLRGLVTGALLGAAIGLCGLLLGAAAGLRGARSGGSGADLGLLLPLPLLNIRRLFDESPAALLLFRSRDGIVLEANTMAARHYGQPPAQLRGRHLSDLGLPTALCAPDLKMGAPVRYQDRAPAGALRDIEIVVNRIPWRGPALRYAHIYDRTPLSQHESSLSAMIAAAMDGIIQVDAQQRITLVNGAAERMFGYTSAELLGQQIDILIPEAMRARHQAYAQGFIESGATARRYGVLPVFFGRRRDGTLLPVEISLTTAHTDHAQITTAIVRDASDRLAHEREQQLLVDFTAALRGTTTSAELIAAMADQIGALLSAPHLLLLLCDEQLGSWQIADARGGWADLGDRQDLIAARSLWLPSGELSDQPPADLRPEGAAILGLPLFAHQQRVGALWVGRAAPFDPSDRCHLAALAEVGASALRRSQWNERLERANVALREAYDATIAGWARALDLRDRETEDHSRRVADLTVRLARRLGVDEAEVVHLRRGALLHDIGKMGVPDAILNKAGPLTDEEWAVMREHPADAYRILEPIAYLRPSLDIPLAHHERWDGSGYPAGLRGEAIPFAARIFAVVDVWDALTNNRPYRAAWDAPRALAYLQEHAGGLFDPRVVAAFIAMMREQ